LADPAGARGIRPFYSIHPFSIAFIPILGQVTYQKWTVLQIRMALKAYAKLQYVDMSEREREELTLGLKKYCELDTLAMVMIYEHFREVV
jgi:hypothetical protein